jgi:hypothetical protein
VTAASPENASLPGAPLTAAAEAPCPVRAAPAQASLAHRRLRPASPTAGSGPERPQSLAPANGSLGR